MNTACSIGDLISEKVLNFCNFMSCNEHSEYSRCVAIKIQLTFIDRGRVLRNYIYIVLGSCEHGNELLGSIKCWEVLE
jgi:hypothetical protein